MDREPSPRPNSAHSSSERILRNPVDYRSINSPTGFNDGELDSDTSAVISRYKYYSKLAPHSNSGLVGSAAFDLIF